MLEPNSLTSIQLLACHNQIGLVLGKVGQESEAAVAALEAVLSEPPTNALLLLAAESLGAIDPENAEAIAAVIDLFERSDNPETRLRDWRTLSAIDPNHPKAIEMHTEYLSPGHTKVVRLSAADALSAAESSPEQMRETLLDLVVVTPNEESQTVVFSRRQTRSLVRLLRSVSRGSDTGDSEVIESLEASLRESEDIVLRVQIAEIIGLLDYGNTQAVSALGDAIDHYESITPQSFETMWQTQKLAKTLGTTAPQKELTISTLTTLLETTQTLDTTAFEEVQFRTAQNLLQLEPGHTTAINTLLTLLDTASGEVPWLVAESLGPLNGDGGPFPQPNRTKFMNALTAFIQQDVRDAREIRAGIQSLWILGADNDLLISVLLEVMNKNDLEHINHEAVAQMLFRVSSTAEDTTAIEKGLIDIIQEHESWETQLIAAETLIRILSDDSTIIPLLHQMIERAQGMS